MNLLKWFEQIYLVLIFDKKKILQPQNKLNSNDCFIMQSCGRKRQRTIDVSYCTKVNGLHFSQGHEMKSYPFWEASAQHFRKPP
jgi:hypothetical protein